MRPLPWEGVTLERAPNAVRLGNRMHLRIVSLAGPLVNAIGSVRMTSLAIHMLTHGHTVTFVTSEWPPTSPVLLTDDQIALAAPRPTNRQPETGTSARGANTRGAELAREIRARLAHGIAEVSSWPDRPQVTSWRRQASRVAASQSLPRPDVIVSSVPEFSCHVAASRAARKLAVPWVPDYRDLWSTSTYYSYSRLKRSLDRTWERNLLGGASALTATTPESVASLRELRPGVRGFVIMNGFDKADLDAADTMDLGPGRHLVYAGTIYPGKRDPYPVLRAIADTPELSDVVVHLVGPEPNDLEPDVASLGLGPRLRIVGRVSRSEALAYVKGADVALLLTWDDPGESGVVSAKVFEYIGLRKSILATGYRHGRMAKILDDYGFAEVANDPETASFALRRLLRQSVEGPPIANHHVAQFDRLHQLERWRNVLESAAAGGLPNRTPAH